MAINPNKQDGTVLERQEQKLKKPSMYKVVLLNDDFTPMEFVVMVVQEYFNKDRETATQIMLKVHREGREFVGSIRGISRRPKLSKSLAMHGKRDTRCSA